MRPAEEFSAGHIPGARSLPLEHLEARLDELDPDLEVVAYCRGPLCLLAPEAVALLRGRGRRARCLEDGLPEWRQAGLPVEEGIVHNGGSSGRNEPRSPRWDRRARRSPAVGGAVMTRESSPVIYLDRNGRPAAILVSPDDLEALEDTLDLLSDPKALKEISEAREEISEGRVVDAAALRAKYLAR